jgi:carbon storage regulator
MLVLSRKVNQEIIIDENIRITVVEASGGRIRLGFSAPNHINIRRAEIAFDSAPASACGTELEYTVG